MRPDGPLLHEDFIWSLIPPHDGMRQYWRDLDMPPALGRRGLEPLGTAQALAAAVPEGLWRNRPLARDLIHGRRHRSDLRRHEPTDRRGPFCAMSQRESVHAISEGSILRKAPDEAARDEPRPHTGLVGE